jgi:cytochrome b
MSLGYDANLESREDSHTVWDLPVRVFHWLLVAAFVGAFVTNKLGVAYFGWHVLCGYAVIVLVAFRIVWGIVGTRHARFRNFVRGPGETLRYAASVLRGRPPTYAGHNPLGALMVVVLLPALGAQAILGLFGNDEIVNYGPLYGYVTDAVSLRFTSLHRHLFYWIAGAIGLHIAAVLVHRLLHGERLVTAMITGRKPSHVVGAADAIRASRSWLAALVVVLLIGVLAWIVDTAPNANASN